jgi:hypothetical protein
MRLPMRCSQCVHPSSESYKDSPVYFVEQISEGAYAHKCRAGHWMVQILNNPRHEVLFESGAVAFLFGFDREALTSFHVALERFYVFSTKVLARHLGISDEDVNESLKNHANLSEREFGAFVFTYLIAFRRPFAFHKELKEFVERRNKVIHAGKIPTRAEVMKHGQTVYTIVRSLSDALMDLTPQLATVAFEWDGSTGAVEAIEKHTKSRYIGGSTHRRMILSYWKHFRSPLLKPGPPDIGPPPSMDLADALEDLRQQYRMYGEIPGMDLTEPKDDEPVPMI